jgi:hypothetical protein
VTLDAVQQRGQDLPKRSRLGYQVVHQVVGCHQLVNPLRLLLGQAQSHLGRNRGSGVVESFQVLLSPLGSTMVGDADLADHLPVDGDRGVQASRPGAANLKGQLQDVAREGLEGRPVRSPVRPSARPCKRS